MDPRNSEVIQKREITFHMPATAHVLMEREKHGTRGMMYHVRISFDHAQLILTIQSRF